MFISIYSIGQAIDISYFADFHCDLDNLNFGEFCFESINNFFILQHQK